MSVRHLFWIMILWRTILKRRLIESRAFRMPHAGPIVRIRSFQSVLAFRQRAFQSAFPHDIRVRLLSRSFSAIQNTAKDEDSEALAADGQDSVSPILQDLNPSQIEAVTQPLSAISRVVAGPGSGKTRVLTCRIAYLLQQDPHSRILGVTFTRKAAGEMQQRLEKLLIDSQQAASGEGIVEEVVGSIQPARPNGLYRVSLGTFHSICAKILRWNGELLSTLPSVAEDMVGSPNATMLDGSFAIVDQAEQLRILRDCLTEKEIDLKDHDLRPLNVLNAIGQAKARFALGENAFEPKSKNKPLPKAVRTAAKVYQLYREKLISTNCIDFDDLIYMARELLMEYEDVRGRLQQRWTHVLVDEFQDTSRSQMDLVKLLTSSSLFVVGDADQSIYSWRGAHAGSLSDFSEEFRNYLGGVNTVYLMENYRSTSNIVKAAQKVISSSSGKSGADKLRQNMKPKRGSGPTPRVLACKDDKAEADYVVKTVSDMVTAGKYGPDYSVAFIYRTNAQTRALEEACVKYNLPYVIFGSATSFYKRQEIKDCLCFFRWLYNGRDRSSMLRAMKTPTRGIGDVAIREFDEYCALVDEYYDEKFPDSAKPSSLDVLIAFSNGTGQTVVEGLPPPSETLSTRPLKVLTQFSEDIRLIREKAQKEPVENFLASIVDDLQLIPHFDKISKSKAEFEERQANVRELQKAAQRYTRDGPCLPLETGESQRQVEPPLGAFLDDIALVTEMADDAEQSTEERFVVSLMTIHASKGMEFDTVFVVGNEDGTFPTSQALQEGDGSVNLEEEKRLCYVAMTRAKTELFMTWRREVPIFTPQGIRSVDKDRSRFLDVLVSSKRRKKESGSSEKSTQPTQLVGTSHVYSRQPSASERTFPLKGESLAKGRRGPPQRARFHSEKTFNIAPQRQNQKFEGTSSVYSQRRRDSLEAPPPTDDIKQRPIPRSRPSKRLKTKTSSVPRSRPSKGLKNTPVQTNHSLQTDVPRRSTVVPSKSMDSTWFFPVGSHVEHKDLGRGTVLPPPLPAKSDDLLVLVEFENGIKKEFPVRGSQLSPVLS